MSYRTKLIRYKQSELPPMTEQRKAELAALAEQPDNEIDYSDIPSLEESFWARGPESRAGLLRRVSCQFTESPQLGSKLLPKSAAALQSAASSTVTARARLTLGKSSRKSLSVDDPSR